MKLSFYNAGRDGNFMFYHLAVLKGVLNRYSPKIVILDFVAEELHKINIAMTGYLHYYHIIKAILKCVLSSILK